MLPFSSAPRPLISSAHRSFTTFIFSLLSLILFTGCPNDPPEPDPRDTTIFLELKKTWTTSITLKISVADTSDRWSFSLSRDDSSMSPYTVTVADTIIVDNGLEPDREYRYRAYWLQDSTARDSSNEVIAMTMDTTSHNFIWTIDTLGSYGSYLRDVSIVDENNIWVVGNIETDSGRFNAAHWDGDEWELILIRAPGVIGEGIFYFAENDIWVATGIIYHWNGEEWERYHLWDMGVLGPNDGGVTKIWGSDPDNLYFVGRKGSIVHYNRIVFTRMESGTDVDLTDIWGIDENNIFAVGSSSGWFDSVILRFNGSEWTKLYERHYPEPLWPDNFGHFRSVWAEDPYTLYLTGGNGTFQFSYCDTSYIRLNPDLTWVKYHIRGNHRNDLFTCGQGGELTHFNGISWYIYPELINPSYILNRLDLINDLVVFVGWEYTGLQGIPLIITGRR